MKREEIAELRAALVKIDPRFRDVPIPADPPPPPPPRLYRAAHAVGRAISLAVDALLSPIGMHVAWLAVVWIVAATSGPHEALMLGSGFVVLRILVLLG